MISTICLLSMEPWAAAKKSFKLVWQCHQLLSGFLAKGHFTTCKNPLSAWFESMNLGFQGCSVTLRSINGEILEIRIRQTYSSALEN